MKVSQCPIHPVTFVIVLSRYTEVSVCRCVSMLTTFARVNELMET